MLQFLLLDEGFGFEYRLHRWGAVRITTNQLCHSITTRTTTTGTTRTTPVFRPSTIPTTRATAIIRSSSLFFSRSQQLQVKKASMQEQEEEKEKEEETNEIKDWLQNRLNMTDKEFEKIYNTAGVFRPRSIDGDVSLAISSRIESLENKIDLIQTRINATDRDMSILFSRSQMVLRLSSEAIAAKLDWLQERLDLDDKQLSTLVRRASNIFQMSMDQTISPRLEWLEQRLDLKNTTQLRAFVLRYPGILYKQADLLEGKLNWYTDRFDFPDSERAVKKIVLKVPALLSFDVDAVNEKLIWIQNRLGLTDSELYKIIQLRPHAVTYNVENKLEPILCYLTNRLCLINKSELRDMVCKYPTVLGLSINNVASTIAFYEQVIGTAEAHEAIRKNPLYLGYSLEGRLKPRLDYITKAGLVVGEDLSLQSFVQTTKEAWEEKYGTIWMSELLV